MLKIHISSTIFLSTFFFCCGNYIATNDFRFFFLLRFKLIEDCEREKKEIDRLIVVKKKQRDKRRKQITIIHCVLSIIFVKLFIDKKNIKRSRSVLSLQFFYRIAFIFHNLMENPLLIYSQTEIPQAAT